MTTAASRTACPSPASLLPTSVVASGPQLCRSPPPHELLPGFRRQLRSIELQPAAAGFAELLTAPHPGARLSSGTPAGPGGHGCSRAEAGPWGAECGHHPAGLQRHRGGLCQGRSAVPRGRAAGAAQARPGPKHLLTAHAAAACQAGSGAWAHAAAARRQASGMCRVGACMLRPLPSGVPPLPTCMPGAWGLCCGRSLSCSKWLAGCSALSHSLGCRLMSQGSAETSVVAFTTGTAVLAMLSWLAELRCCTLHSSQRSGLPGSWGMPLGRGGLPARGVRLLHC